MSVYERLLSDERVENMHPRFTAVVNGVRVVVANCVGEDAYLTDEGKEFFGQVADSKEESSEKPVKKRGKAVESANTLPVDLDGIDLEG